MGVGQINPSSKEGKLHGFISICIPKFLFQAETYQGEITNDTHGTEGPIKVSFSNEYNNVGVNFLEVTGAYDKERSLTDDVNTFASCDQYGVSNAFIMMSFTC